LPEGLIYWPVSAAQQGSKDTYKSVTSSGELLNMHLISSIKEPVSLTTLSVSVHLSVTLATV